MRRSWLRVLVPLLVVGAVLFGGMVAVTQGDTPRAHHRAVSPPPKTFTADVTVTARVLDDAGARCASSPDASKCPPNELLYPVHPPIGTSTDTQTVTYVNGRPIELAGCCHWGQGSVGWKHFPCYCNAGRVLIDLENIKTNVCITYCTAPAFDVHYWQQLYGEFAQAYAWTNFFNVATYWSCGAKSCIGAGTNNNNSDCDCHSGVWNVQGVPAVTHYVDNLFYYENACGDPGGGSIAFDQSAGDMQFTSDGNYAWTGWWMNNLFNACFFNGPKHYDGTHMA